MPYLQSEGRPTLFYQDWGSGKPIVFCSAWSLSSAQFRYQMLYMVEHGYRAIAYDRRGHGRSDDPGTGFDFDTLADDLAALIEHLDLRDVTLVAHSLGGGDIVRYLTRHGDQRVARIVLLAAMLPFPLKTESNPEGVDGSLFEEARAQWRRDFGRWLGDNEGAYFGDGVPGCSVSEHDRRWTIADLLSTSFIAVLECNRTVVETDFRAEMRAVEVPALIIQGDRDFSIALEISGVKQAELLPNSRLIVYENCPHGLYLTHADRVNRDLLAFVEDGLAPEGRRDLATESR